MRPVMVMSVLALAVGEAAAQPRCAPASAWTRLHGAIESGSSPCELVLATDAAATPFAWLSMLTKQTFALPLEIDVTWRRLDSQGSSLELQLAGGASLLFHDGSWLPYLDSDIGTDAASWVPAPGLSVGATTTIHVVQYVDHIELAINGSTQRAVKFVAPTPNAQIGLAAKSQPGSRSRIDVMEARVYSLTRTRPGE